MACAARTCAGCAELSGTPRRAPLSLLGRVEGAGRCRAGAVGGACGRVDSRGSWRSGYHSRGDGASGNLPAVAGQRVSTALHPYPIAPADLARSTGCTIREPSPRIWTFYVVKRETSSCAVLQRPIRLYLQRSQFELLKNPYVLYD